MHKQTSIPAFIIVAALAAWATGLGAYNFTGGTWAGTEATYYINPANRDMSESAAIAAIQAGAMAWSAQTNANFSFYYMGRTSGSSAAYNGKNEVFFRNEADGGTIARTYWWYNSRNELLDADIMFLDGGWRFFPGSSGCSDGMYLEDIAAHEFGHALGLSHSNDSSATMYAKATRCSTDARTLAPDDIAGVERLYPPVGSGSNSSPSLSISAPSNGATYDEGTSISFSGTASDKEDGNLSTKIVWTSSRDGKLGTGANLSRSLTAGSHTITAEVSDTGGRTASKQISIAVSTTSTMNQAPVVTISSPSDGASLAEGSRVAFRGTATDKEDGDLTSRLRWRSNLDGKLGTGGSVNAVLTRGTHIIRALVKDSSGVKTTRDIMVTVSGDATSEPSPSPSGIMLAATKVEKKKKRRYGAVLTWSGATSARVDLYRNGVRITTTSNDGRQKDTIGSQASGSYSYVICESGTTICSNAALVSF